MLYKKKYKSLSNETLNLLRSYIKWGVRIYDIYIIIYLFIYLLIIILYFIIEGLKLFNIIH